MKRFTTMKQVTTSVRPFAASVTCLFIACALITHSAAADPARDIVDASGVTGGLVVHLGFTDPGTSVSTAGLCVSDSFVVHGLSRKAERVAGARKLIRAEGRYGPVSVDQWLKPSLPYGDNLVNLIVVEEGSRVSEAELLRVLAPRGVVMTPQDGRWVKTLTKPWLDEMDEWNHYLHGADGNPVADDDLVGPPKRLQWVGSPRWARHHDHMASMTSLVSSKGRLFYDAYVPKMIGNNMPVALSDVLSCDGENIWMRSQKFDFEGRRHEIALQDVNVQPADDAHLFCQIGFLDDSYFFRSYWTYGRRVSGGYGYWLRAGRLVPSGRILCYDDEHVYGFGRKPQYMTNASVLEYEFFAADKAVSPEAIARVNGDSLSREARRATNTSDWRARSFFPREALSANSYAWTVDQPAVIARAMTLAGENVFFAGPPSLINERRAFYRPDDAEVQSLLARQAEAFDGRRGGQLWAVSKKDGSLLGRYALDSPPAFDGMIAAAGRLYTTTVDGHVLCLSAEGTTALAAIEDQPLSSAWDQPEDPDFGRQEKTRKAPAKRRDAPSGKRADPAK